MFDVQCLTSNVNTCSLHGVMIQPTEEGVSERKEHWQIAEHPSTHNNSKHTYTQTHINSQSSFAEGRRERVDHPYLLCGVFDFGSSIVRNLGWGIHTSKIVEIYTSTRRTYSSSSFFIDLLMKRKAPNTSINSWFTIYGESSEKFTMHVFDGLRWALFIHPFVILSRMFCVHKVL